MRRLRPAGIALGMIGILLLGGACATVLEARTYQARQERAFSAVERRVAAASYGQGSPALLASSRPTVNEAEADPLVLGRIEIPRIGVSATVREGDDDETLAVAVGHVPGTARPGEKGNMALAGHRDSFFRALRRIDLDDVIRIQDARRGWEYRVDSIEIVQAEETRVLDRTGEAVLTLVTCSPSGYLGNAPKRFVVHASRIAP